MDRIRADGFARTWVSAWNDRDIDAILSHYHEAVVFHSPRIGQVMDTAETCVRGKSALRTYWTKALALAPKLYFELDTVLLGSDSLTILYTNHRDQRVAETFVFDPGGQVVEAIAAYE